MNETINESVNETVTQIPEILGVVVNVPLTFHPVADIFFLTVITALFTTIIRKYLTDQAHIRALRKDMKDLQKKMRDTMKKDPNKAQKLQQEIMKKNMENMKNEMNPKIMLTTMIPLLFVFFLARKLYEPSGDILFLGFTEFTWLGTYIIFSIINSIIIKKILNVA